MLNDLRSRQPLIQGERCESHTKKHLFCLKCFQNKHCPFIEQKMSTMKRRSSEDTVICEELQGNLTQCDYTHGKGATSRCRSPASRFKNQLKPARFSSAASSPGRTRTGWLDEEGPPGCICSAGTLGVHRQVKAPVRWGGTSTVRGSSGLRRESLDDSPVVFDDNLVALLQLFVLCPRVHLTHVGHQLLRAEALLHLRQLPLIFLHRIG